MAENRYRKLTPEQKDKYYGEDRNRRRRERYAQDQEYRSKILVNNRESYYERTGRECRSLPTHESISSFLAKKHVRRRPKGPLIGELSVVRRYDLIHCMGVSTTTLSRWVREGLLPDAELFEYVIGEDGDIKTHSRTPHYTHEEALRILDIYSEHVMNHGRYTNTHVDTKNKFFAAIKDIRKDWIK